VARVAAECPLAGGLPTGGARAGSPATDGPPTALSRLQGRTAKKHIALAVKPLAALVTLE